MGTPRARTLAVGTRYGRLLIVRRDGIIHGAAAWLCQCDCGNQHRARYTSLNRGEIVSCGCKKKEILGSHRTHGMKKSPEWRSWESAISRCNNPNHTSFPHYGGRGISVCDRWRHSFEAFYADMGKRPSPKHSLDRFPDQNGNYEPGNCRWATWTEQANNKRNNRLITIEGRTQTVPEWSRESGVSQSCLFQRLARGWSGRDLLRPSSRGTRVAFHAAS
jgi:hypothetical protein